MTDEENYQQELEHHEWEQETTKSFYKEVWDTLKAINVNEHTNKKGNLTYLSWAWAWGVLMDNYPESYYEFDMPIGRNSTLEVWVTLTIKDGDKEASRKMWLPVMDYKNHAIPDPTTREVSDTRMRCLTKAMAMFGLGHYIYAGEDIPSNEPEQMCPEPVNQKHVYGFVNMLIDVVGEDVDVPDYERVQAGYNRLTNDEKLAVYTELGSKKPEGSKRGYKSILKELVKMKPADLEINNE